MKKAIKVLEKDPVMKGILHLPVNIPYYDGDVLSYLYSSIISQQLSTKSAQAIYGRFLNYFDGNSPEASVLLETDFETLRSLGLSGSKARYLINVADHFHMNPYDIEDWRSLSDEKIIDQLTSIKGVGIWTAQMVLMFCLARKDIFPIGDLGISQSMIDLYDVKGEKKEIKVKLEKIAEVWKPYRSIASLYLWSWRNRQGENG